jgi:hypothetical protein
MMMTQVVWNKEWIRPYESSWSIFEKFSYANLVKKTPILKSYGSEQVKHIKHSLIGGTHRGLIYLNGFNTELLSEALEYDIKQHLDQLLRATITILPDDFHWFHGNLKWCDECLQYGYHSIFHQFVLLHHCPFHLKYGKTPFSKWCKRNALTKPRFT